MADDPISDDDLADALDEIANSGRVGLEDAMLLVEAAARLRNSGPEAAECLRI